MIEINYTPADNLDSALDNLYTIITLLRSPEGCPWDRIQTNKTTTESLIDESYEYLDGVIRKDIASEREEIGDVMINVFMNLRIHEESGDFKPYEAVNEVCEKLIRRHPHVFSDAKAENAGDVLSLWNSVKENVEGHKDKAEDFFSHIPSSLPPLESAYEIQKKLKKVGFDWENTEGVIDKVKEELEEVEEAIDSGDKDHIEEEIGDVMINVFMNLRIHEESGDFKPYEAVNEVCEKLIRRHPHVFSDAKAENAGDVLSLWNSVKENVEGHKDKAESFFSHIPSSLPPLESAYEIQKKLKKVGFDWENTEGVIDKVKEELEEVEEAIDTGDRDHIEEEIGDLLFSVINLSRFLKIRPNTALFRCNNKIKERFQKLFGRADEKGIPLDKDHVDEMNALWDEIKKEEK